MDAVETATLDVVENGLLNGRVRLRQPAKGYRAGMDAALLAAATPARPSDRVIEAGCGAGGVLIQIAARCPQARLTGLERDSTMADLAKQNAALNDFQDRVAVQTGDVAAGFRALGAAPFDWAVSNPPFFDDASALRAPAESKRNAWMADDGLEAWTRFLLKAVREGGRIVMIHRADRLADILRLMGEKAGSFVVRPIHPFADEPAKRILVQAVKTGRAPLRLLPPLILHDRSDGKHTQKAEAILRGETPLEW
ncbi:tRNA1(Val) (adenine(37)-N6)-methyltransferase [Brevundimonas sp. SORGH_AS_0993]|uniref:tRNA1(Val) (adenine(37)-N6)-methyltransferase n=1 Tax=Brevundimonas sp. SORGH_AS_0993 TaxID=3041794 RepID=UPI00278B4DD9|nr:methyltransferase [Brevundimonas sp. SORGH_AS_0993]MDQ1153363.1 tRNA1(Val) A37 N6-methylase TrmN6 [Brevundimonas sp. SORGH_AS_0993]